MREEGSYTVPLLRWSYRWPTTRVHEWLWTRKKMTKMGLLMGKYVCDGLGRDVEYIHAKTE